MRLIWIENDLNCWVFFPDSWLGDFKKFTRRDWAVDPVAFDIYGAGAVNWIPTHILTATNFNDKTTVDGKLVMQSGDLLLTFDQFGNPKQVKSVWSVQNNQLILDGLATKGFVLLPLTVENADAMNAWWAKQK